MEALEFMRQKKRMCDYYGGDICVYDDSRGACPAFSIGCSFSTDEPERLVAAVEKWAKEHPEETEQERQEPEHPEESSDLHAIIDALEDRIDKLDEKVSNEALIFREVSKQNQDAHRQLADRITALEKYPVESMNEPKRTNKDVLLAAFPDARMDDNGIPYICTCSLDKNYNNYCDDFADCSVCKCAYWLAEVEE